MAITPVEDKPTMRACKRYGQEAESKDWAIERLIAGDGVFVFHEQDGEYSRITASDDLNGYVVDHVLVVAAEYLPQAEDTPAP